MRTVGQALGKRAGVHFAEPDSVSLRVRLLGGGKTESVANNFSNVSRITVLPRGNVLLPDHVRLALFVHCRPDFKIIYLYLVVCLAFSGFL